MVLTSSNMATLGRKAAEFNLPDPAGKYWSLNDFKHGKGLLVIFLCNHCPYIKHISSKLSELVKNYQDKSLKVVGINSNDIDNYPLDSPENMAKEIINEGYTFPYLFDESQQIAHAYGAACTPDFFLFDNKLLLVYRGQFDDSRPGNGIAVTGNDLEQAIQQLLKGEEINKQQTPSIGCNIKWKSN